MESKKENVSSLEEYQHLCVSPRVVETISPEDVSVAVLRHLRQGQTVTREVREEDEVDHFGYGWMPEENEEKWSTHQSSKGITFCVVTELSGPFITVFMPGE